MGREIASTARPTSLRLAGFVSVAIGAMLAGIGATARWAVIGFPQDLERAADLPVHGTDVWEGKVVLLGAAVALVALLAMRLTTSDGLRRGLAIVIMIVGIACVLLAGGAAVRARDRFGGEAGVDLYAASIAAQTGQPEDVVRDLFEEQFDQALRVEIAPGIWLTVAGGILLVVGGVLGAAWARRRVAESAGVSA